MGGGGGGGGGFSLLLRVPWHASCVVVLLDFLTVSLTAMFPCSLELGSSLDIMVGVGCKSCFDLNSASWDIGYSMDQVLTCTCWLSCGGTFCTEYI